ncbi:lanthionine synthetase LanC family protein [Planotetraspora sp. GP83]|uniref:lanthionine synthetase LanC family protein n=1 Tax=Planotetraspora sp. GP83 TaxID=3156264 RepID=UPI0035196CC4
MTRVTERPSTQSYAERLLRDLPAVAPDGGAAILAAALSGPTATRALASWLRGLRRPPRRFGLFGGGTAERLLTLRIAATSWPRLAEPLAEQRDLLVAQAAALTWRDEQVGWPDYDLISGPGGVLLAMAADPGIDAVGRAPLAAHLMRLCGGADLSRLRVGPHQADERRAWNIGRINLGLAHGLPGILTALRAAAEVDGLTGEAAEVLRRLADRMVAECYLDDRGVFSWPPGTGALHGQRPLQAWCYGCPSNAWVLWETARVLDDAGLAAFALEAAASFVTAYDDDLDLRDLAICHGAAGLLLIFDAFSRFTPLPGAAALATHLQDHLLDRPDEIAALAATDWSLMNGASGVLAALLTVEGGNRRWLAALGLR